MSLRRVAIFCLALASGVRCEDGATVRGLPALEHVTQFENGALPESSGVVQSPGWGMRGVYWTHPDSKNKARLFAFNLQGQVLREVDVMGATNRDWEEIAADDSGRLIVADIGDNKRERASIKLYRFTEPDPFNKLQRPEIPDVFEYHYPEAHGKQDAEALVVRGEAAFLFTKDVTRVRVYRLALPARVPGDGVVAQAEFLEEAEMPANVTGAALSEDGQALALLTYLSITVIELKKAPAARAGAPAGGTFFNPANQVRVRSRLTLLGQSEALCWSGKDLVITTEGGAVYRMKGVRE